VCHRKAEAGNEYPGACEQKNQKTYLDLIFSGVNGDCVVTEIFLPCLSSLSASGVRAKKGIKLSVTSRNIDQAIADHCLQEHFT
jgi:hypothetical protein